MVVSINDRLEMLKTIRQYGIKGASSRNIGPATYDNDAIRQSCRRRGLIEFTAKGKTTKRWHITEAGIKYLNESENVK